MDRKKIGIGALALALSCGLLLAQEKPTNAGGDTAAMGEPLGAPVAAEMIPVGPALDGGLGAEGFVDPDGRGGPRRLGPGGERGVWGHERGGRGRHGFGLSRALSDPQIQQKVGISADQVAKIRSQETAFRKTSIQQRADLEVKQIDLREMLAADKPDRAAIDRKLQEISTSRLAMEKSRVDFRLSMKDALTPEQREKLKQAMKEKWEARRGERGRGQGERGQRGPGGQGGRPAGPPQGGQTPGE